VGAQEHSQQSLRRNQSHEAALCVDDGEARLAVLGGLPSGVLLVRAGRDDGGISIHELPRRDVRACGQHTLDRDQAEEPPGVRSGSLADGDVGDGVELAPDEPIADRPGAGGGRADRHPGDDVRVDGTGQQRLGGHGRDGHGRSSGRGTASQSAGPAAVGTLRS
jgi:hypothetical protein